MSLYYVKGIKIRNCYPRLKQIQGFQPDTVLQLSSHSQQSCRFYITYVPSKQIKQNNYIQISEDFLHANNLSQGYYKIECVPIQNSKKVVIKVRERDWEIIAQKKDLLQSQFFNQVRVVWKHLKIPLYYNNTNYVLLQCLKLQNIDKKESQNTACILQQDSLLEIHQQQRIIPQKTEPSKLKSSFTVIQKSNNFNFQSYYDNFLSINPKYKQIFKQNIYYRLVSDDFIWSTKVKKIQDFLKSKNQEKNTTKNQKQQNGVWLAKFKFEEEVKQLQICYVSSIYNYSFNLPMTIKVQGQFYKDNQNLIITNQLFAAETNDWRIYLMDIGLQQVQNPQINYDKNKYNEFLLQLIDKLKRGDFLFYNHKLICIRNKYFYTFIDQIVRKKTDNNKPQLMQKIKTLLIKKSGQLNKKSDEALMKNLLFLQPKYYENQIVLQNKQKNNIILNHIIRGQSEYKQVKQNSKIFQIFYKTNLQNIKKKILEKHIIISSPNKNGKTFLHTYLQYIGYDIAYLDFYQLSEQSGVKLKQIIQYLESLFIVNSNRIIYLDNISNICKLVSKDLHRQNQFIASKILSRHLIKFIKEYTYKNIIITSPNPQDIDPQLLNNLDFQQIVLKNPTSDARTSYFYEIEGISEKQKDLLVKYSQSMSFGQFIDKLSTKQKIKQFYQNDIQRLLSQGMKQDIHDFTKIAGLKKAKALIIETIQAPTKFLFLYKNLPIKLPRGILVYGPSGVGKTFLATSVKEQLKIKFYEVKGSDILNKYIGSSQQAVRDIFERAMAATPSIIFFDQFQSIVPRRNQNNTGVTDRIVNQFLCYLDGVSSTEGVFIIAASSRPDLIDPALLRPGRIDRHVYLEYPNDIQRQEILELYSKSIQFQHERKFIVQKTKKFSYSDIVGLIKQLRLKKANLEVKKQKVNKLQFKKITKQFFEDILSKYKISRSQKEQKQQNKIYEKFLKGNSQEDIKNQKLQLN